MGKHTITDITKPLTVVDVNRNNSIRDETRDEESRLYDLITIGIKAGGWLFFGTSYSIRGSHLSRSEFVVKNHRKWKYCLRALHLIYILYWVIPFITEPINMSPCCLVNWIKRGLHVIFTFCIMATHYCLEIKGRRMGDGSGGFIPIYKQCVVVQNKFRKLGVHFPARSRVRVFGWLLSLTACTACLVRQFIFSGSSSPWYARHARVFSRMLTMGLWVADNETVSENMAMTFGSFGLALDGLVANFWFFGQLVHFLLVLTAWLVFHKLNRAWAAGNLRLPDIIDLHFQAIKLLKEINQLIAPLTFWSLVFNVAILCFWTNYFAMGAAIGFRPFYILALCNLLKITVELLMEADVNWKAHRITEWLEESCATTERFPRVDSVKMTIFTTQVYNQDKIGFRGLNYFVVTPRLAITVVGIVITYSVAVNQFCHN